MKTTDDDYLFYNDEESLLESFAQRGILCSVGSSEVVVHLLQPLGFYLSETFLTEVREKSGILLVEDIIRYKGKEEEKRMNKVEKSTFYMCDTCEDIFKGAYEENYRNDAMCPHCKIGLLEEIQITKVKK